MSQRPEVGCQVILFLDADEEVVFGDNKRTLLTTEAHREALAAQLVAQCSLICQLKTVDIN